MKYEIEKGYLEYTPKPFAVFVNDEFADGFDTLAEAFLWISTQTLDAGLAEIGKRVTQ